MVSRDLDKNQPFKLSRLNRGLAVFHCLFVTIELYFAAFYAAICIDDSLRRDLKPDGAIFLLGIASATVALGMWVTLLVSLRNLARPTLFNERCSSVLVFLLRSGRLPFVYALVGPVRRRFSLCEVSAGFIFDRAPPPQCRNAPSPLPRILRPLLLPASAGEVIARLAGQRSHHGSQNDSPHLQT